MEIIDLIIQISLRDYCSKITPMKFTNQSIDSYISKIPEYSFAIKKSYIDSLPNTTFFNKVDSPCNTWKESGWTEADTDSYRIIYMLITKSMLQAEKKLSKKTTNKYQWSPTLKNPPKPTDSGA